MGIIRDDKPRPWFSRWSLEKLEVTRAELMLKGAISPVELAYLDSVIERKRGEETKLRGQESG